MLDLTPAFLAELRRLAEAATPGPWTVEDRRNAPLKNVQIVAGFHRVAEVHDVHQRDYQGSFAGDHAAADAVDAVGLANAAFIAATDPATVLALVDEVERLRADRDAAIVGFADRDFGRIMFGIKFTANEVAAARARLTAKEG
jgi:hypothetical protein